MLQKKHNRVYIYGAQVLFVSLLYGAPGFNIENLNKWLIIVARFTTYKLLIHGFNQACFLIYSYYKCKLKINVKNILIKSKLYIIILLAAITLLIYNKTQIITEETLLFFIASLIIQYPDIMGIIFGVVGRFLLFTVISQIGLTYLPVLSKSACFRHYCWIYRNLWPTQTSFSCICIKNQSPDVINYAEGMACSFFEGYLVHIIPSDGHKFGFEENIVAYEAKHQVVFPVKRLLLVITKSLFCPPDLKHFNKTNKNIPFLEDCTSLSDVQKDVAGVKNRIYRNSNYKIHRPGAAVVYVSAICATPMNTLHRVLDRTALYNELANVDRHELRDEFSEMLKSIINSSPESRGKCELVYFDDEDPTQNLADVLLDKIRELEPEFENIISKKE